MVMPLFNMDTVALQAAPWMHYMAKQLGCSNESGWGDHALEMAAPLIQNWGMGGERTIYAVGKRKLKVNLR